MYSSYQWLLSQLHREAQNYGGPLSPIAFRVLRVLSKVNLPKFTRNDIPLFLGITGDLFPEAGWVKHWKDLAMA
jgi:hypothetical protein